MRKYVWVVCALVAGLPTFAQQASSTTAKHSAGAAAVQPTPGRPAQGSGVQPPAHPITVVQAHEMMRLTGANNLKKQMLNGFMPYIRRSMPFLPEDVLTDLQSSMEQADFEPMIVKSYQAHISTEDATKIIAFYRSAAGQRLVVAMPQILGETQQAGAQMGQQVMMAVLQRHKAEIQAAAERYQQEHSASSPQQ